MKREGKEKKNRGESENMRSINMDEEGELFWER